MTDRTEYKKQYYQDNKNKIKKKLDERKDEIKQYKKNYGSKYSKNYNQNIKNTRKKSKEGLLKDIYLLQKGNSKSRGHEQPKYTSEEFINKYMDDYKFNQLYIEWVESGYDAKFRPSTDRINDNEGYSFENIQWMTWQQNNKKWIESQKVKVKAFKNNDFVGEYESIEKAAEVLGLHAPNIHAVLKGRYKTTKGFFFIRSETNEIKK